MITMYLHGSNRLVLDRIDQSVPGAQGARMGSLVLIPGIISLSDETYETYRPYGLDSLVAAERVQINFERCKAATPHIMGKAAKLMMTSVETGSAYLKIWGDTPAPEGFVLSGVVASIILDNDMGGELRLHGSELLSQNGVYLGIAGQIVCQINPDSLSRSTFRVDAATWLRLAKLNPIPIKALP